MTNHEAGGWHREVVTASTEATLRNLSHAKLLDRFYLAGGTGLALHFGHRLSRDLDFFSADLFDEEALLQRVQASAGFSLVARAPHSLHTTIQETKVSFLGYDYPLLFSSTRFLDVAVADPRDIACMKVSAIASRGTKRDFVDLYVSAQRFGLGDLLGLFDRKYSQIRHNRVHVLKSLTFFEDTEKDPMPHMLISLEWDEVKRFFLREVPRILQ
jgi:Nucleotidyl transferase AbiEii toxin, Type IV TA system